MMMNVRNKDNCILNHTAPVPWPSPLTRVVSLDSLSPVLSLTGVCGSWQTPLSWSHHLSPHWTSLWARDLAQSSRARVTSSYSHCHIVRFTTHPARKSGNLNQSPIVAKALPLSTIANDNGRFLVFLKFWIFGILNTYFSTTISVISDLVLLSFELRILNFGFFKSHCQPLNFGFFLWS